MQPDTLTHDVSPLTPEPIGADGEKELEAYEEEMAMRWRSAILRLSETFVDAADERSDLSSILLEAMHNALNNLLIYGEAGDLMALEEWLSMEDASRSRKISRMQDSNSLPPKARGTERRGVDRRARQLPIEQDRRIPDDRRLVDRREVRDWQFEDIARTAAPNSAPA